MTRFWLAILFVLGLGHPLYAQLPNIRVSNPASTSPEEVTIAINPANPSNLAAGANIRFAYFSTDAGQSWSEQQLPFGTYGDPCVIFDGSGRLYYGHLANLPGGMFIDRLIIHRSTNGGRTWKDSVTVGLNPPKQQDKEWLAADNTGSAFHGNIYMAWTQFDAYGSSNPADSSRILFSRSTNGGDTWSVPLRVGDRAGDCLDGSNTVEGAVPAVGPNGEVYVSWSGPLGIMFDKSTDGGVTFGDDRYVGAQPGGWAFDVPGISRCNGLPVTACDVSTSSYRRTIYVIFSDQRNGPDNTDVFLIKSTNGGENWTAAKKINDDQTISQQFFPWATVDPITGTLYCVFYDRRATAGNATDVYMAKSVDGGETFSNFKISQTSFMPTSSVFFGDYINVAALDGLVCPIWMRLDTTRLSVWTAPYRDAPSMSVGGPAPVLPEFRLWQNYPNPFNPTTVVSYQLSVVSNVRLVVYDVLGREVAVLVDERKGPGSYTIRFNAAGLASGVYFYRLSGVPLAPRSGQATRMTEQKSMVVVR